MAKKKKEPVEPRPGEGAHPQNREYQDKRDGRGDGTWGDEGIDSVTNDGPGTGSRHGPAEPPA